MPLRLGKESLERTFRAMANHPQSTAEQVVSKTREEIVKEAKRISEDLLCSSKSHFSAAQLWGNWHFFTGIPLVVLSALAASPWLKGLDKTDVWALAIPTLVLVLSAVVTFVRPSEHAAQHLKAGNQYDSLMNEVRIFWTVECASDEADSVLLERLKDFSANKAKLNASSPKAGWVAFQLAKRGIEKGEGLHEVDKPTPLGQPPTGSSSLPANVTADAPNRVDPDGSGPAGPS